MARYKLMGYEIEGTDTNVEAQSMAQQTAEKPMTVVYETDDGVEARAIVEAGGFFRDRDNFVSVITVQDSQKEGRDQPDTPFFRPPTFPQKGN